MCNTPCKHAPKMDLFIEQGVDYQRSFQIRNKAGEVQDLSNWVSITGHAKRVESPTASIVFAFDMEIDYDENRVIYGVPASTSLSLIVGESEKDIDSRFYYDFVVELLDGTKFRIQQGRVMVYRAITKVTL